MMATNDKETCTEASKVAGELDGIICSADDVVSNVMANLRKAKIDSIIVDPKTGKAEFAEKEIKFGEETENVPETPVLGSLSSQFAPDDEKPIETKYSGNYSTDKVLGVEVIVEAIVREVLDNVVNNATVVMKERMDKLEDDYNKLMWRFWGNLQGYPYAKQSIEQGDNPPILKEDLIDALYYLNNGLFEAGGGLREESTQAARDAELTDIGRWAYAT